MKNNTKIIKILIIVLVVIILIVGCLFIFLATDLFKSNKTLFAKYAIQLFGKEDSFIESNVLDYYEKLMETPFENETTLSFNSSTGTDSQDQMVNQLNITLNGKADAKNEMLEENLSINYSPEVTFPVTLRYKDGLFGYQTDYVGSKYIVDDRNQSNSEGTSEIVETEESITQEDMENFVKKYGEIVFNQLSDDKFSKEENGDATIYKMTLTETDIANVTKTVLETLKQDQDIINKFEIDTDDIDDELADIEKTLESSQNDEENNIEVSLFKDSGNINKVEFKNTDSTATFTKTTEDGNLQYAVVLADENISLELDASYNDLSTLQNIEDNYSLKLNTIDNGTETNIITYNLSNKLNFVDSIEVEGFYTDNAVIYSEYEQNQVDIDSFADAVDERLSQVNQMQMEELGLSTLQNPLVSTITPFVSVMLFGQASQTINSTNMETQDVESYNSKFEVYEGTNIQGTTVRGLLTTISNNNGIQEDSTNQQNDNTSFLAGNSRKIEEINFNGEEYEVNQQNIAALKEEVQPESYYRVEFEKDPDTGLIYRAVINPK